MTYLGRRPAALAIRAYRRWVSGRGPLRRVCCTFATTESCSAYGLRAVEEIATSLPEAIGLVRARLCACRRASIYRFANGLGWERHHELAPVELLQMLERRDERPATIAQVLAARTAIARWRGERDAYREAKRFVPGKPTSRIPVRAGDAAIEYYGRAARRGLVLTVLAAVMLALHVVAIVPLVVGIGATASARAAKRRLEQQRVAAKFLRPATS